MTVLPDDRNLQASSGSAAREPKTEPPPEPPEPFACPHCGQMLAPECRVCVACRQPIEIDKIGDGGRTDLLQPQADTLPSKSVRSHFSWAIFFVILAAALVLMSVAIRLIGLEASRLVFVGIMFICAGWVFYDARFKGIPRPWRWSIMTLFFWIVFFPWYLGRRRTPESPCAVMESPTSVFFRALFWFVLILLFLTLLAALVKSPPR